VTLDNLGMKLSLPYNFKPRFLEEVVLPFARSTESRYPDIAPSTPL